MDFVGPILEILKCTGPPLCKYIEYHRKLEEYKQNLNRILEELKSQKDEIETRLKVECSFGKLRKYEVIKWLENVQRTIHNVENVEQTFNNGKCLSRVCQAKLVEKKIQQMQEYRQKGSSFDSLVIDEPPASGIILPTTPLVGETTAKKNMEEIWRHLMDDEIKNIGIFGMGGVGKTTIVTHINNRLIEEDKFHHVMWVTVSQTLDLVEVQNGIANALNQSLLGKKDQKIRAGLLLSMLRKKRFVLILDDTWEAIKLEKVGIPKPTKENGCKLVITTRSLDVCHSMNCKTVEVKPLLEKEALDLFFEKADCVKLHDVVRDMVLRYITSESPLFIVKAGLNLKELPSEQEWKENLDKVSLMNNSISEIPSSMSLNCQMLSTLFLQENPLESIPESFFLQMHGLMILNLSETAIESLPNSISELTNLTALLLKHCYRLKWIPSLSKLRALRILDLGFTKINEVPTGMEMLTNLTSLHLFSMELHKIPVGIFPKLCRLQKLVVRWGLETPRVAVEEAARLKNLDSVMAQFRNLQDFNCYVKSLNSHGGPNGYYLFLYPGDMATHPSDWRWSFINVNKEVTLKWCNIHGREEKYSIILPKDVECLSIDFCEDVTKITDIPTFNTLERLEILKIWHLDNLTVLLNLSESTPPDLKVVRVHSCLKVKKLFASKRLLELKNLEWIDVYSCPKMEELITVEDDHDNEAKMEELITIEDDDDNNEERRRKEFLLPKLKKLSLSYMPELKNICSSIGVMVCDSLQEIVIENCPQLERLPLYLPVDEKGQLSPPPVLQKIRISRRLWEALKWDHLHPNAKTDLLLPFCEFSFL
ncbi:hypothetical protein JRO89_XS09G0054100 [Xanthoceras sorbifolium]|uniref:NB-ARC domain-containing protein n=1 Tax=Xanthoceras sorbifolium TaxID=99658 RepID=A0ABQ8HKL3_9ROSI|nr:hypothetical protein JRO89_XS09G0054100 [Xanthoceras sorbifolium]